jgi:hypothetical protein
MLWIVRGMGMVNDFNRQDAKCAKEEVKRLLRLA